VWMFIHNIQGAYDGAAHAANNHYAPINTTVGPSVGRCVWLTGTKLPVFVTPLSEWISEYAVRARINVDSVGTSLPAWQRCKVKDAWNVP